jgi:enoyl-CoA hydratase/carnithine racemase
MATWRNWSLNTKDGVATVTLCRTDCQNNMDQETLFELRDMAGELQADSGISAAIVQGEGDHFSTGLDLQLIRELVDVPRPEFGRRLRALQQCFDAWEALEKPTIAKVQGFCLGGGLILALCCDFRIASSRTIFSMPEVKLGVAVVMGTHRLTRVAGLAATRQIVLFGDRFNAAKAESWGLVDRLVAPEDLDAAVRAQAAKMCRLPTPTLGIAKRIINEGYHLSLRESQDLEIAAQAEILQSPALSDALARYLDKLS